MAERRVAADREGCSDLIAEAARGALATARISPLDLDRIIVSATPRDFHLAIPPISSFAHVCLLSQRRTTPWGKCVVREDCPY